MGKRVLDINNMELEFYEGLKEATAWYEENYGKLGSVSFKLNGRLRSTNGRIISYSRGLREGGKAEIKGIEIAKYLWKDSHYYEHLVEVLKHELTHYYLLINATEYDGSWRDGSETFEKLLANHGLPTNSCCRNYGETIQVPCKQCDVYRVTCGCFETVPTEMVKVTNELKRGLIQCMKCGKYGVIDFSQVLKGEAFSQRYIKHE